VITNNQLVDSLVGLIRALPPAEQNLLAEKLFFESSDYPSSQEIANLSVVGGSFDFLASEPDLYDLDDGEPVS
jgi:hypothetical protein